MLGEGYPIDCFTEKQVPNELLCSICFDVARSIMSCNVCDRSFCEPCITRYWLFSLHSHQQCPCCKESWTPDDDGTPHLQYLKNYTHRDRKCENILRIFEMSCPCNVIPQLQNMGSLDSNTSVEDVATSQQESSSEKKKRGRRKIKTTAHHITKEAAASQVVATEKRENKCTWRGTIADYDQHLVDCHPSIAPGSCWTTHYINKLRKIPKQDYLLRLLCIKQLLQKCGTEEEVQHLAQLSVAKEFMDFITEPYFETSRLLEISRNENCYFQVDNPERALILHELTEKFSPVFTVNLEGVESKIMVESFARHVAGHVLVPFLVDFPVISKEELLNYDQRFCGLVWCRILPKLIASMDPFSVFSLFNGLLILINPRLIRESEACMLSLMYNVTVLNIIAREAHRVTASFTFTPNVHIEFRALSRMAYLIREVASWQPPKEIGDTIHLALLFKTLQAIISTATGAHVSECVWHYDDCHNVMENTILPLMCTINGDKFHNVVLYSGGFRYLAGVVRLRLIVESAHQKMQKASQIKSIAIKSKRSKRGKNRKNDKEQEGEDESTDLLIQYMHVAKSELPLRNMYLHLWILTRLCETTTYHTIEEYKNIHEPVAFMMNSIDYVFSPTDCEQLINVSLSALFHNILLDSFRMMNNLIVRMFFAYMTMFGANKDLSGIWQNIDASILFQTLCVHNRTRIQLDLLEYELLYHIIMIFHNLGDTCLFDHAQIQQFISSIPATMEDFSVLRHLEHLKYVREFYYLQDREFVSLEGFKTEVASINGGKSAEWYYVEPGARQYSSCMVDIERSSAYSTFRNLNSFDDSGDEEDEEDEYTAAYRHSYEGFNAPELYVHVGALNMKESFETTSNPAKYKAAITEAKEKMHQFRVQRELQYFQQIFYGMDIFVLEHLYATHLSRYVLSAATRSKPPAGFTRSKKGGKCRSSGAKEWKESKEHDILCIVQLPSHAEKDKVSSRLSIAERGNTTEASTKTRKVEKKQAATIDCSTAGNPTVTDALRIEALREWILICDITKSTCAMYYDEGIVALYLLLFGVNADDHLVWTEKAVQSAELPKIDRLHSSKFYENACSAARLTIESAVSSQPIASDLYPSQSDRNTQCLTFLSNVITNGVTLDILESFVNMLCRNILVKNGQFRFFSNQSAILWRIVHDILSVFQQFVSAHSCDHSEPSAAEKKQTKRQSNSKRQKSTTNSTPSSSQQSCRPNSEIKASVGVLVGDLMKSIEGIDNTTVFEIIFRLCNTADSSLVGQQSTNLENLPAEAAPNILSGDNAAFGIDQPIASSSKRKRGG